MKVDMLANGLSPVLLRYGSATESSRISGKMQASFVRYDVVKTIRLRYLSTFSSSFAQTRSWSNYFPSYAERAEDMVNGLSKIAVTYEEDEYGRYHPAGGESFGLSLQSLSRSARNALVSDDAVDIDIVNSAPSVILSVCKMHDIPADKLEAFCQEYKRFIAELLDSGRDDVKATKNWMLFGSGPVGWDLPPWVKRINRERDMCVDELKDHYEDIYTKAVEHDEEKMEEHRKKTKKNKTKKDKDVSYVSNVNGIFMNYLYQQYEGKILVKMDQYGRDAGMWNMNVSWIHDGILVHEPSNHLDLEDIERFIKNDMGISIKLARKSTDDKMEIDTTKFPKEIAIRYSEHHLAAAKIAMMSMEGQYVMDSSGHDYILGNYQVWDKQTDRSLKASLLGKVMGMNFKLIKTNKEGEDVEHPFSASQPESARIASALISLLKQSVSVSNEFAKTVTMKGINKIKFEDGYYEFLPEKQINGKYGVFVRDGMFDSFTMVRHKFPARIQADVDFVMENIINPIFDNTEDGLKELFLKAVARSLAGSADKITYIIHGPRNSGKSVLFQFLYNAFPEYCSTIPSSNFAVSSHALGGGDSYRGNGFMVEAENARILKMSEMPPDGRTLKTKIDGSKIKVFQSMKEGIMARGLHQMQRVYYSLATGFFLMNDVPEFVPLDSMDKCHLMEFPNEFVSAYEKAEHPFDAYKKLAKREVEQWVLESRYKNAFMHILFDAYDPSEIVPLASMLEAKIDCSTGQGDMHYLEVIEVTMDKNDKLEFNVIKKALEKNGCKDNPVAIGRNLMRVIKTMFDRLGKEVPEKKDIKKQNTTKTSKDYGKQFYYYVRLKDSGNVIYNSQIGMSTGESWENSRGAYASDFVPPSN